MTETDIYKKYILEHHGPQALERLDLELAIAATDAMLSSKTATEFNQKRIEYAIEHGHNKNTQPDEEEAQRESES